MAIVVKGTRRSKSCDKGAYITELIVDASNGLQSYELSELKPYADQVQLIVYPPYGVPVRVRIFYSFRYGHWVATTNADDTACNNLLRLPIYSSAGHVCAV
jgi:hypothetical protein